MSPTVLLLILVQLAPYEPRDRLLERATAITAVTQDVEELAALVAIDFAETTLGRAGVPFGACAHLCSHRCSDCSAEPLRTTAAWALGAWRSSRRQCGGRDARLRFGWYHSGVCRRDRFADREAALARRLGAVLRASLSAPTC